MNFESPEAAIAAVGGKTEAHRPADGAGAEAEQRKAGANKKPPPKPLPFFTFKEAEPATDGNDFVEGLLLSAAMSVVYGASGSGKTFFVLDLALTSVAAGQPWRDRAVDRGAVLYLALEGSRGIKNRITAIKRDKGWEDYDMPFAVIDTSVNLLDPDADMAALIETVQTVANRFDLPVRLTVIDTLSRAIAGGNENNSDHMGALVRNGDRLRQATGAHVMWVHHSGKDDARGARGHSLLRAATDTEIEITADGLSHIARVTKQRDLECAGEFAFTLRPVELSTNRRGKAVTSCVVEHAQERPTGHASARLKGHEKRAHEVLINLIASSGETSHADAPSGIASVPEAGWREQFYDRAMPGAEQDTKKKAFRRASDRLVESHVVGMAGARVWLVSYQPAADAASATGTPGGT